MQDKKFIVSLCLFLLLFASVHISINQTDANEEESEFTLQIGDRVSYRITQFYIHDGFNITLSQNSMLKNNTSNFSNSLPRYKFFLVSFGLLKKDSDSLQFSDSKFLIIFPYNCAK